MAEYSEILPDEEISSYTANISCSYAFLHENEYVDIFDLTETFNTYDLNTEPEAYLLQKINTDQVSAEMEGYYYKDTFYNTYNGFKYKEEMKYDQLLDVVMIKMDQYLVDQAKISSLKKTDENTYEIVLKPENALEVFRDRYDVQMLSNQIDFTVTGNQITQKFEKGVLVYESSQYMLSFDNNGKDGKIRYKSEFRLEEVNQGKEIVTDEIRNEFDSYVDYNNIDDSDIPDEGSTVYEILQNRMVSRLGYELVSDGKYRTLFNDYETYTIDFINHIFEYKRYSISYSYNWKSDTGSMGKCTYDYDKDQSSGECDETTITTLKEVKDYLEMELQYCDMSLEDLVNETK